MKKITILILAITAARLFGQTDFSEAVAAWENGNVNQAIPVVEKILEKDQTNNDAKFLQMKVWFVQGKYKKSLESFSFLEKSYKTYNEAASLAAQAYIHLHDYENALKISELNKLSNVEYLKEWNNKPFTVKGDRTLYYTVSG